MTARVEFRLLGSLEVAVDGALLPLGGAKQRSILALLVTEPDAIVPADRLVDVLWGESATERSASTLHVHVSNLRKALQPAADALGGDELVVTRRPGYVLVAPGAEIDLRRFEQKLMTARRSRQTRENAQAVRAYLEALELWRGEPLADLRDESFARTIALRLEGLRRTVLAEWLETELALGHPAEVSAQLAALVEEDPLDERLRGLLMVALYRSGRQADALAVYQEGRRVLVDELGIEPGPALRELESRILAQDAELDGETAASELALSTVLGTSIVVPRGVLIGEGVNLSLDRAVTTIGRLPDRDLVVDDPKASRQHAEIRLGPRGFRLVDPGSTNGTRVNGDKISSRDLLHGDEITIGRHTFRFELE